MTARRVTIARIEQMADTLRDSAKRAATFSDVAVRTGALLGGVEGVLCVLAEEAAGPEGRALIEAALKPQTPT